VNTTIKAAVVRARPGDMMYSGWTTYSFPSGHTTTNIVLYGLLSILLYPCLGRRGRIIVLCGAMVFALTVAFSRVYLGAHWFSDVLGGVLISTLILCVAGARYYAGKIHNLSASGLLIPVLGTFLIVGSFHVWHDRHPSAQRYAASVSRACKHPQTLEVSFSPTVGCTASSALKSD
ncbi:MAG: phosphatase PAP2 family protein, partial [Advenella sp.]